MTVIDLIRELGDTGKEEKFVSHARDKKIEMPGHIT
jgi:hypothetical protein